MKVKNTSFVNLIKIEVIDEGNNLCANIFTEMAKRDDDEEYKKKLHGHQTKQILI